MGRYGRRDKVRRFVGQGGGDDRGNDNKVRGNILIIPPFVCSLSCYLRRRHDRNWNRNQNWNGCSRSNTKRRTISTATGNHPRRKTISISKSRGRGFFLLQEGGRWMTWEGTADATR